MSALKHKDTAALPNWAQAHFFIFINPELNLQSVREETLLRQLGGQQNLHLCLSQVLWLCVALIHPAGTLISHQFSCVGRPNGARAV